ncbi:chromate efflux transporter [Actinokineospora xionganensis]|uniref:Chromate efflux transporter n=1 Tax=Actinokineospora xionganensis TaxID=2684470 RepID=A0ABR7KZY1_9PSEU|nr:chromate efflux transporter [Actinokineospora xionganensis]MBC6445944.1 chromate efflux transporter [Actinokineospora xionganensis]
MSEQQSAQAPQAGAREALRVFWAFFTVGALAFGGPAATQGLVYNKAVTQLKWISERDFLDLMGVVNLLPGPNAVEMAMHIGRSRAGKLGFIAGGLAFMLPGSVIAAILAAAYMRYGDTPSAEAVLYGVKPVVIAVTAWSAWRLARSVGFTVPRIAVMALALIGYLFGVNETLVLLGLGAVAAVARLLRDRRTPPKGSAVALAGFLPGMPDRMAGFAIGRTGVGLDQLALVFFKAGALMFGGGTVLLAVLRAEVVVEQGWLTEGELLEAITIGQITPGPILTTATFVGYLLAGSAGAVVATVASLIPSFALMTLSRPLIALLRRSPTTKAFLDGVTAAAVGVVAAVTIELAGDAIVDWVTAVEAVIAMAVMLWRPKWALAIVLAGALIGGGAALIW